MTVGNPRSWGNFPHLEQSASSCHWPSELPALMPEGSGTTLAYGAGRSYGDVCLAASGRLIDTRPLDRFIKFDPENGTLTAEAGVRLRDILALIIPRGWFLPVVPGTQEVTLGGAIANDVHGKNHHHKGTFGRHLIDLDLWRSDRGPLHCSPRENSELFGATIGGLGLTGVITSASIRLMPLGSSRLESRSIPFARLSEFFSLSDELDGKYEYTAAWLDCQSAAGRGVFTAGRHSRDEYREFDEGRRLSVPFTLPFSAVNRLTLPLLNRGWYWLNREAKASGGGSYRPFLFPLDGIGRWNRLYGRRGFQQYQCVIPRDNAQSALEELVRLIARSGTGSFLSVLKRCGSLASPGLLSFPLEGTSLALDFPQGSSLASLFAKLDHLVSEAGGRLYPAKDAHMPAALFQQAYPAWETLESLRDPALLSTFWSRVTATGGRKR